MLWTTSSKTIMKLENKRKGGRGEINNEVGSNDNRSLYRLFKDRKNTFSEKKFLIPEARLAFTPLREAFIDILILYHFLFERYIRIKINRSSYMIGEIFVNLHRINNFLTRHIIQSFWNQILFSGILCFFISIDCFYTNSVRVQ